MLNVLKIKNVVKSNDVVQVYDIASVTGNTGRYVKLGVTTHNHYNNDVSMLKSQYIFDTTNNVDLFNAIDETLDLSRFVTIGDEVVICGCITMHDIIDFYANGCIQQFYECFCESHSAKESEVLARFLSAIGIEIWRNVTCHDGIYKGRYMVSNLGRVLSLHKKNFGNIVKQDCNPNGYLYVKLYHNGQAKGVRVHRLVGLTFIGEPIEKLECCHSNTNRLDNRLFNLEFKTQSENMLNPITQRKLKETLKVKFDKADKDTTST